MARASKASTASKTATPKQAATKKAAPVKKSPVKKAMPKKAMPKKAMPKKATPKTASVKKPVPKKAPPKKSTVKKPVPKKAPPKKSGPAPKATPSKKPAASPSPGTATAPAATNKKKTVTKTSDSSAAKPTKATPKRAKKVKSPFDSRFLERQKKLLKVERDTYERQAINLKAEADSLVMDMDPGDVQFDEESGEGDTIAVERGRDLALAAKALEMIEEIDHANTKFELGTYGICEVSGEPIPEERLEAIPWAREKVEFKVGGFGRR